MFKTAKCKYCTDMEIVMQKIEENKKVDVFFNILDDEKTDMEDIAVRFGLMMVPYTLFFFEGNLVSLAAGARSYENILSVVEEQLKIL